MNSFVVKGRKKVKWKFEHRLGQMVQVYLEFNVFGKSLSSGEFYSEFNLFFWVWKTKMFDIWFCLLINEHSSIVHYFACDVL